MPKSFLEISKQECLNNYQKLIDNSVRHFKVAEIIFNNEEYGIAISHLILGTEELVKAFILYLEEKDSI